MSAQSDQPGAVARRAIVVLGMHRSGTSAITRVCNLLGAALPIDLLPPGPDNEAGYWESRDLFEINRALLAAAGTVWFDDLPIPDEWFKSERALAFRPRAEQFLRTLFHAHALVVLKDPRLCRLWPFWRSLLDDLDVVPSVLLAVRHPVAVFHSLRARADLPEMLGAAITSSDKSHLLWLRHVLESEYQTRGATRVVITYDGLLTRRDETLRTIVHSIGPLPVTLECAMSALDAFLTVRHRHHQSESDDRAGATVSKVYETFARHAEAGATLDIEFLNATRDDFAAVEAFYAPLRFANRLKGANNSFWEPEILTRLTERARGRDVPGLEVLYVSGNPNACGHVYRVVHQVAALRAAGLTASWKAVADVDIADIESADVVVIWRTPWTDDSPLTRLHQECRARRIPVGFDVDDLVFDPSVMTLEHWDYLRLVDPQTRRHWLEHVVPGYARTLANSDFALVSTSTLARAAEAVGSCAYVLPNGLDEAMITAAGTAAGKRMRSEADGYVRVGYASGTPTHQKDFAVVAPVLASLLESHPAVMLTIVGCLLLEEFPELAPYRERMEIRPLVPFADRFAEYARFDVNIAPLELGNPFCEGKSELKYYEPALLGVPTVASATVPFSDAIAQGETGFVAHTHREWYDALHLLIHNRAERSRIGELARVHAIAAFGPDAQRHRARAVFGSILRSHGPGRSENSQRYAVTPPAARNAARREPDDR